LDNGDGDPPAHAIHTVIPGPLEYWPAAQAAHDDDLGFLEKVPALHAAQAAAVEDPAMLEKVPASHGTHWADPSPSEKDPFPHATQPDAPASAYIPGLQLTQMLLSVAMLAEENLPWSQSTHSDTPLEDAKLPGGHGMHSTEFATLVNQPASQGSQGWEAPSSREAVPGKHVEHSTAPFPVE